MSESSDGSARRPGVPEDHSPGAPEVPLWSPPGTYDPLRLCIYTTVAVLAWLTGPVAVAVFAALGLAGYVRARRAGLQRSRCVLRDTRLVIAYLAVVLCAAVAVAARHVAHWLE